MGVYVCVCVCVSVAMCVGVCSLCFVCVCVAVWVLECGSVIVILSARVRLWIIINNYLCSDPYHVFDRVKNHAICHQNLFGGVLLVRMI